MKLKKLVWVPSLATNQLNDEGQDLSLSFFTEICDIVQNTLKYIVLFYYFYNFISEEEWQLKLRTQNWPTDLAIWKLLMTLTEKRSEHLEGG